MTVLITTMGHVWRQMKSEELKFRSRSQLPMKSYSAAWGLTLWSWKLSVHNPPTRHTEKSILPQQPCPITSQPPRFVSKTWPCSFFSFLKKKKKLASSFISSLDLVKPLSWAYLVFFRLFLSLFSFFSRFYSRARWLLAGSKPVSIIRVLRGQRAPTENETQSWPNPNIHKWERGEKGEKKESERERM